VKANELKGLASASPKGLSQRKQERTDLRQLFKRDFTLAVKEGRAVISGPS
jgi:hypothetical protein